MSDIPYKSKLRAQALQKRQSLSDEERAQATSAICARIVSSITSPSLTIAGYAAIRGELDVFPALEALAAQGHITALPVLPGPEREMHFCRWQPGEPLIAGTYSIPAPQAPLKRVLPDIVLVPLLAFDRKLHRLGYGAGYYDTALAHLRQKHRTLAIGVAFSIQEEASVGALAHDQMLDRIITEKEILLP